MSRQFWSEALVWVVADGTAIASSTTETAIFPAPTIPANYMQDGRILRLEAWGKLSTTATPTIGFFVRWGAAVSGTLLANSELITTASGAANTAWYIKAMLQTRTNGSAGTIFCMGNVIVNLTASTNTAGVIGISGFDAPAAATCALNADTALTLSALWSANSASNTLTGHIMTIESLN